MSTTFKDILKIDTLQKQMKEVQDSLQVGLANTAAIVFSITQVNQILTLVSLTLAIAYTIYKFVKFEERQD